MNKNEKSQKSKKQFPRTFIIILFSIIITFSFIWFYQYTNYTRLLEDNNNLLLKIAEEERKFAARTKEKEYQFTDAFG